MDIFAQSSCFEVKELNSLTTKKADDKIFVCKIKNNIQAILYSEFKDWRANSVDLDEVAHHEPLHQDLHCLQIYLAYRAQELEVWSLSNSMSQYAISKWLPKIFI